MATIDPGLAIAVVGAALTLTMGLTSIYNGRKTRELIREEERLTRELIKEESRLMRELMEEVTKSTQELIKEESRLTREILDRMDKKLDAIHNALVAMR